MNQMERNVDMNVRITDKGISILVSIVSIVMIPLTQLHTEALKVTPPL